MLEHAQDRGIDLLVMGAWGHSRIREIILGGVTREVLAQMTLEWAEPVQRQSESRKQWRASRTSCRQTIDAPPLISK